MSLITVNGENPFSGQSDPYVSTSSDITYNNDSPVGEVKTTYTLNGALTGCTLSDLEGRRDALVASFNYKNNSTIPSNIKISGVIESTTGTQLRPTSLSFDSTNYLGALPYTLTLEVFTGYDKQENGDDKLFDKVHTVTENIDAEGNMTRSVEIGCTPSMDLTGCDSINKANEWIKGQLGILQLKKTNFSESVTSESLTIDPETSAMTYNGTYGTCGKDKNTIPGQQYATFSSCKESTTENSACAKEEQVQTTKHNVAYYQSGASRYDLVEAVNRYIKPYDGIHSFSSSYDLQTDTITASFEVLTDGNGNPLSVPKDLLKVLGKTTLNTTYSYTDAGALAQEEKNGSVNGDVQLLGQLTKSRSDVVNYSNSDLEEEAKSLIKTEGLLNPVTLSESIDINTEQQTKTFSYSFADSHSDPNAPVVMDDISGITSYTIDFTPSLEQFDVIPNIGSACINGDLKLAKGYSNQAKLKITVHSVSGQGYDYKASARKMRTKLKNKIITNPKNLVEKDSEKEVENCGGLTLNYEAVCDGNSVITKEDPKTLTALR